MNLAERYPEHELTLEGLSLRLRYVKAPAEDPLLKRELECEVSDEAHWVHKSWWLPAQPEVAEKLAARLGAKLPDDALARCEWLQRVAAARDRANRWRALPIAERRAWVMKQGLRVKKFAPLDHQITGIGYGLLLPLYAALFDTGLGKTYIIAKIMEMLKEQRGHGPFLVVAPKSLLRVAWGEDIEKHTWLSWLDIGDPPPPTPLTTCPACGREFGAGRPVPKAHLKTHLKKRLDAAASDDDKAEIWETLFSRYPDLRPAGEHGHRARVEAALRRTDIDVYVINPERAKACLDVLKARKFAMLAVDESSMMRAHNSQTTEALIDLAWTCPRRVAMSGTPRPNSNLELWGQFAMLHAPLCHSFSVYQQKYFQKDITGYHWITRPGADDKIAKIVESCSIRYRLGDCVDLPPETTETREVELSDELRVHYRTMLEDMLVKLEDETISTPYKLVQVNKLAQITSGFIYDAEGNVQYLSDGNPKLSATVGLARELVEAEQRQVVIWIRFSDVEATALSIALGDLGVSVLTGGLSADKIQRASDDFKSGKNKIMVAHPLTAKFGHTWTHATVSIFHSYDYSWENYYQARHRIYRIGQTMPVTHINIVARKTVDRVIMKALERKEGESAVVIDRAFVTDLRRTL